MKELEITQAKNGKAGVGKSMADAFSKYSAEVSEFKKGRRLEQVRLNALLSDKLARVSMPDLSATDIAEWRDRRLRQVSAATVNRELNLLSAMLNKARLEWLWITHNPVSDIKRPKNPKPRDVRIDDELMLRITDALGYNGGINTKLDLIAVYFLIAIETAMRQGEICGLTKNDIFLDERYVVIRDSKNSDSRHVPLSGRAVELFAQVLACDFRVSSDVTSTLFRRYLKKAGIEGIHFHDTRHEALTRLARKLDVLDLARMVGHRDPRSLMIYYNATASEIASRLD